MPTDIELLCAIESVNKDHDVMQAVFTINYILSQQAHYLQHCNHANAVG